MILNNIGALLELGNKILDRSLPQTVESMIAQELLKGHNRYFNKFIWNANSLITATTGAAIYRYTDGLIRRAFAASSGSDQTNFPSITNDINSVEHCNGTRKRLCNVTC